ncbi:MAG TPA: hypothetical protein PKI19_00905 [Elusimicrobiales bacterium]|nr:hypothetical protein [Elusimicrobiales bacterium]
MPGFSPDFDDLLSGTELDSAKMVLRLTAELREKDLELASMRSRSFEEIQRNNKAREEEFEALMRAQDERIKKREQELARMLVEKESGLWQKYQVMLDEAVSRQRADFETERARLSADIRGKEAELADKKKNLRQEMETLFKKWEAERETDFKAEREAFLEKLKLGRETAQKEAAERIRQIEELWREKLGQQEIDFKNREALAAEGIRSQMRRERVEELKVLNDRLNAEFAGREKEQYAHYTAWLEENKKTIEEKAARRAEILEAEYRERAARLEDALEKARQELPAREAAWTEKYNELKKLYTEKEAALAAAAREQAAQHLAQERDLAQKRDALAREAKAEAQRQKDALQKKEKELEAEFSGRLADFEAEAARRARAMDEREAHSASERAKLADLRAQIGSLLAEKEAELEQSFEERQSLLRQSLEESLKIKETGLAKKQEDLERQYAALAEQKDAALARVNALLAENSRLKDALVSHDAQARTLLETERTGLDQERKRLEEDFREKIEKLKLDLNAREQAMRADYEEKFKASQERQAAQLKIREAALEEERIGLNRRAAELEAGFFEALKTREMEVTANFRRNAEVMRAQAEAARQAWKEEKAGMAAQAEQEAQRISAMELEAAARREAELRAFYDAREKESLARASQTLAAAEKHLTENFEIRERDLQNRARELEEKIAKMDDGGAAARAEAAKLKEEIERLARALEESAGEKQGLIQENLTKARDLRQALEKEFLEKLKTIEQNYLAQLTELAKRSDVSAKAERDEYFKKMQFMNDDFNARLAAQAKSLEETFMERERKLAASMEEAFKLKGQALQARQEQLESSYQAMLSEKTGQIDMDRALAENISRMKDELETKNRQLSETIAAHEKRVEELEDSLRAEHEARKKDLEDGHRIRASQLEAERAKLRGLLEQEQRLVADLQKRDAALQDSYAAREADMARRFKESRERLEKEYQERLLEMKKNGK